MHGLGEENVYLVSLAKGPNMNWHVCDANAMFVAVAVASLKLRLGHAFMRGRTWRNTFTLFILLIFFPRQRSASKRFIDCSDHANVEGNQPFLSQVLAEAPLHATTPSRLPARSQGSPGSLETGPVEQSWRENTTAAKKHHGYLLMFRCVVSRRTPPRKYKICIPHAYCFDCWAIALVCSVLRPRTRLQPSVT